METCHHCNCRFEPSKVQIRNHARRPNTKLFFCSNECYNSHKTRRNRTFQCKWCGKEIVRPHKYYRKSKSGNQFCSRSCAASHNNTQKRKSRRSKCEIMLYDLLKDRFSELEMLPNDKTMLDGYEVDIGIPSLKLGIEWNGIVHYKPVYGETKFDQIKQRDATKQHIASEKGITLIVVPDLVSTKAKVKEAFLDIAKTVTGLVENRTPAFGLKGQRSNL